MDKEKLYVSHYINESFLEYSLKKVDFITTFDKEITDKTEFYMDFNTKMSFTKKDLEFKFKVNMVELPRPLHEIKENEGIWIDKDKNVYLRDGWKPFGNYERIKIS